MTVAELKDEALKLSLDERADLVDALNVSLSQEPPTAWQVKLLDERLAEDDRDPDGARPGDELRAWLRRSKA